MRVRSHVQPAPRAARAVAPTRAAVLATAQRYVEHRWSASPHNAFHGVDNDGVRVDTPDDGFTPVGWRAGVNRGMPYCWGGFDTPATFDDAVARGFIAGFIFTDARSAHPRGSRYAAGVDCSGFVSRCWGLSEHVSTMGLPRISTKLASYDDLLPGDIVNKPGAHVLLFQGFVDAGRSRMRLIEAGEWRVKRSEMSVADAIAQGFSPLRDARRPL